jgi:hypothetical protein
MRDRQNDPEADVGPAGLQDQEGVVLTVIRADRDGRVAIRTRAGVAGRQRGPPVEDQLWPPSSEP